VWIRSIFSTRSIVYVLQNWQDKPCKQTVPIVDKKWLAHWNDAFAHLVLWISFGLSTGGDPLFFYKTMCPNFNKVGRTRVASGSVGAQKKSASRYLMTSRQVSDSR
jgi:hypothetical protein